MEKKFRLKKSNLNQPYKIPQKVWNIPQKIWISQSYKRSSPIYKIQVFSFLFFTEKYEIKYFRFKHPLYTTEFIVFFFEQLIILCVCFYVGFYHWIISGVKNCQLYKKNRTIRPGKRIFMSLWKTSVFVQLCQAKITQIEQKKF